MTGPDQLPAFLGDAADDIADTLALHPELRHEILDELDRGQTANIVVPLPSFRPQSVELAIVIRLTPE